MRRSEVTEREWVFVFTNRNDTILSRFLKNGFKHVFAMTAIDKTTTLCIEPLRAGVEHIFHNRDVEQIIDVCCQSEFTVLRANIKIDNDKIVPRGVFVTCATYLAYTVGLPFFLFSPYHLYKALLKHGAREILDAEKAHN